MKSMSPLKILLLASCLQALSACSTMPAVALPRSIDPPPASLASACSIPDDLPDDATAQTLGDWALEWIGAWRCEKDKRAALVKAWPQ